MSDSTSALHASCLRTGEEKVTLCLSRPGARDIISASTGWWRRSRAFAPAVCFVHKPSPGKLPCSLTHFSQVSDEGHFGDLPSRTSESHTERPLLLQCLFPLPLLFPPPSQHLLPSEALSCEMCALLYSVYTVISCGYCLSTQRMLDFICHIHHYNPKA